MEPSDEESWTRILEEEAAARAALHPQTSPRSSMSSSQRIERLSRWWHAIDAVMTRSASELTGGRSIHSGAAITFLALANHVRDFAVGKLPQTVGDLITTGNQRTAAELRDVDYGTAYLAACGESGFTNRSGQSLKLVDRRPNKTVQERFSVSYDTARSWKSRIITHDIDLRDPDGFLHRFSLAAERYAKNAQSNRHQPRL